MLSPETDRIRATLVNDRESLGVPLEVQRAQWEAAVRASLPHGVEITPVDAGGVVAERVSAPGADPHFTLLYLHGGGYVAGSCRTHRDLAAHLSHACQMPVLLLDYRLAPEFPFPAAVLDAARGYAWLHHQVAPEQIVLAGDSAGGGLALALLMWLRDHGLPLPAAAAVLSPWTDLALTGLTLETHAARDPLCSPEGLQLAADLYLRHADRYDPLASPLFGDLRNLPPMLIQVGSDEVLLSDSTRLAERARSAGVSVTLEVWDGMWHVWHCWAAELPEARLAITRMGEFVRTLTRCRASASRLE